MQTSVVARGVLLLGACALLGCQETSSGGTPGGHHIIVDAGTEAGARLRAVLDVERNGGEIIVQNLDGTKERIVSRLEGTARVVQHFNGTMNRPALTARYEGDDVTHWGDFNEDTRVDYQYERRFDGGVMVQTWLEDKDLDGEFEVRRTQFGTRSAVKVVHERMQDLDGGGRGYVVEFVEEGPGYEEERDEGVSTLAGCDPMEGFPEDVSSTASLVHLPNLHVVIGGAPGSCNSEQTTRILEALKEIPARIECLSGSNKDLGRLMKSALASGHDLFIGCGGQCPGTRAATDVAPLLLRKRSGSTGTGGLQVGMGHLQGQAPPPRRPCTPGRGRRLTTRARVAGVLGLGLHGTDEVHPRAR